MKRIMSHLWISIAANYVNGIQSNVKWHAAGDDNFITVCENAWQLVEKLLRTRVNERPRTHASRWIKTNGEERGLGRSNFSIRFVSHRKWSVTCFAPLDVRGPNHVADARWSATCILLTLYSLTPPIQNIQSDSFSSQFIETWSLLRSYIKVVGKKCFMPMLPLWHIGFLCKVNFECALRVRKLCCLFMLRVERVSCKPLSHFSL